MKLPLVLCVDDDYAVRDLYESALTTRGHAVISARNGNQALELCQDNLKDIDAVILDYEMPGMNGFELAVRLKVFAPTLPILMVSGYFPDLDDMTPFVDATMGKGSPIMNIVGCIEGLIEENESRRQALSA